MTVDGYAVSFWGNENVLILDGMRWLHNSKNKLKIIESHTLKGSIFWYMNYIIYFLNYILIKLFFSKKKYFAWEKNSLETWDPWRQRELLEEAFDNVKYCIKVKFIRNYFFFHPNYIFTLYVNKSKAIILWCTTHKYAINLHVLITIIYLH